jgi:hypothetical protein
MKRALVLSFIFLSMNILAVAQGATAAADWSKVESIFNRPGSLQGGIYKVSFPRTDLHVSIGATAVEPAAGLGSWIAFRQEGSQAVADGDLVLLDSEVNPVLAALTGRHVQITAIHNHLIEEHPHVMYVHFFGKDDAGALAEALKAALQKTATPMGPPAKPAPVALPFDEKAIEQALGKTGTVNGRVLAFGFPRSHEIHMQGELLTPAMGMATAINFQPSPQGVAATGDFVLKENEVQKVATALIANKIKVTAMHNHLLSDDPHMVFVHFWAEGPLPEVAKGLRQALDAVQ